MSDLKIIVPCTFESKDNKVLQIVLHVAIAVNHFWFQLLTRLEDELCRKSLVLHNIESTWPAASLM